MDDPAILYFPVPPSSSPQLYDGTAAKIPPAYLSTVSNYTNPNGFIIPDTLSPRNIGQIVSPTVDESDRAVQKILNDNGISPLSAAAIYEMGLDDAVYKVAMDRTYSWCALYQCLDPPSAGGGVTFRFFIYTLRRSRLNSRYAMQDYTGYGTVPTFGTNPQALAANQDRIFPVPWYINLSTGAATFVPSITSYPDRFPVDNSIYGVNSDTIASLLRPGSFVVDLSYGYIYQILEIQNNAIYNGTTYDYVVRLRTNLKTPIKYISVVPPDVKRDSSGNVVGFGDNQPVVNVTQQVIRF